MAILTKHGLLSSAQDLVAGAVASTNQISDSAIVGFGPADLWWHIETETIHDGNGGSNSTYVFSLRVATSTALTTYKEVLSVTITGALDKRLLTLGQSIVAANVGNMLVQAIKDFRTEQSLADTDSVYIGVMNTLADGTGDANISVNCALTPGKPRTEDSALKVESNVTVPGFASAGS
ncbi:MAG: hypothetical protein WC196_04855 [Bacilli bacterium]